MDYSVCKEHKHTVAYGTKCWVWDTTYQFLIQHTFVEPKVFHLILQFGGIYAIMGKSHDSTLLHKLTGCHITYCTHLTTSQREYYGKTSLVSITCQQELLRYRRIKYTKTFLGTSHLGGRKLFLSSFPFILISTKRICRTHVFIK